MTRDHASAEERVGWYKGRRHSRAGNHSSAVEGLVA
jgi:hypothetical protein